MLAAERTQIGYQICRQICPFSSLQAVEQGDPIGVYPVIFHFSDTDIFECAALDRIDYDYVKPLVFHKLKDDPMIVASGFHDDDWHGAVLRANISEVLRRLGH